MTSEVNTLSCLIIVFTMVAARRNSPFSWRPSTSSGTVCNKSPFATALMVRVTSVIGQSRSSISTLTELSMSPQAPLDSPKLTRLPCATLSADHLTHMFELTRHALVCGNDVVECVGDLASQPGLIAGKAHGEVANSHCLQCLQ